MDAFNKGMFSIKAVDKELFMLYDVMEFKSDFKGVEKEEYTWPTRQRRNPASWMVQCCEVSGEECGR